MKIVKPLVFWCIIIGIAYCMVATMHTMKEAWWVSGACFCIAAPSLIYLFWKFGRIGK